MCVGVRSEFEVVLAFSLLTGVRWDVTGSRGPERPASEEILSRVAPPSGGPYQHTECHDGHSAARSAGQKSLFFLDSSTNLGILVYHSVITLPGRYQYIEYKYTFKRLYW